MKEKSEHGPSTSKFSAAEKSGSATTRQCEPHVRRMLRIAQACARLAAKSISTHDALEIAIEAKRHLECEIMLARERMRHALADRVVQDR